jgi:predicted esterase
MRHHALLQETVGFYAVFLPPDYDAPENRERRYPLVVILHGMGSTEVRHGRLADTFGREDAIYVAPRAPYAFPEVFFASKEPGYTAWPESPKSADPDAFWETELEPLNVDALYTDWIARCIADAHQRYRLRDERAVLYGHSQGAAFAHRFAVEHPTLVKAYYAFAGYYAFTTDHPDDAAHVQILRQNHIFPMLAHNRKDPLVPVAATEKLLAYFDRHALPHAEYVSDEGDHQLSEPNAARATSFVHEWCCGERASVK